MGDETPLKFRSPSDFAHAINNPIGAILLAAQGAQRSLRTGGEARVAEALELIEKEAERCGEIVRAALSASEG